MTDIEAKLLCVGDMHLGRRPGRLPEGLEYEHGISPRELDPRATWRSVVREAVRQRVDAVLLAGDVVESDNGYMEAYGALLDGVRELAREGIAIVAVAGNHDVDVLPRLADEIEGFHLLGRGGVWTSHVLRRDGEAVARVLGWSFSRRRVDSNPLDSLSHDLREGRYDDGTPDDLRTVGLLHCDLDAGGGVYAPVAAAALAQLGISGWFLGHIHAPSISGGGRPLGYLGSLVSLDPGEPGPHGPWLACSRPGGWELRQIELSPVRWEEIPVPIGECTGAEQVEAAIAGAIRATDERISSGFEGTRVVGCRPRLVGRTSIGARDLRGVLERARELKVSIGDVLYFVDKGFDDTEPRLDLEALARGNDPVAIAARLLLDLREGTARGTELLADARRRMEEAGSQRNFLSLGGGTLEDEAIRRILIRTATRALTELLAQQGEMRRAVSALSAEVGA